MMHEALAGREQHPLRVGLSRLMVRTSEALLLVGRLAEARDIAGRCLALTRQQGERGYEAWARRLLLWAARAVEREPSLLGMSAHVLAVARRP